MNQKIKLFLLCGIITIITTLVISLACITNWTGVTGWSFATMLWSEIVLFGGLACTESVSQNSDQIITRSTLYIIISFYSICNFLLSIAYISHPFLKESSTSFTVLQVIMLAIATTSIAISIMASKGVRQSNEQTMKAVRTTEAMVERLKKLSACPECERYASTLKSLSENLRFTDTSKLVAEDADISNLISTIEVEINCIDDQSHEKIKSLMARLSAAISQRQISLDAANKGKI